MKEWNCLNLLGLLWLNTTHRWFKQQFISHSSGDREVQDEGETAVLQKAFFSFHLHMAKGREQERAFLPPKGTDPIHEVLSLMTELPPKGTTY